MKEYKLDPKQEPGFKNLVTQKRHLLRYGMGLGKTVVGVRALYETRPYKVLILCPVNAFAVWEDHIDEWFDGLDLQDGNSNPIEYTVFRYKGKYNNATKRRALWKSKLNPGVNIFITTYAGFLSDHEHLPWFDCIILDEPHKKGLKNHKSVLVKRLKPFVAKAEYFWPLTGTPGKFPTQFFATFHLFNPQLFSSYWKFVAMFCYYQQNEYGQIEVLGLKNPDAWYKLLNAKSTSLTKKDVGKRPTTRQLLRIEMSADQARYYNELAKDSMTLTDNGELIVAQTSMTKVLRLRQLLICPKILDPNLSVGAAIEDFVDTIQDNNPHTVIFTPFKEAIPHFKEYLEKQGYPVAVLHGGVSSEELRERIASWRKSKGIMINTIAYATAYSLEPASECYFIGYEWDPDDNKQAEDRLNRLTTTYPVNAYYYAHNGTYEYEQLSNLDTWQRQINKTLRIKN